MLSGYGTDPALTALVDTKALYVRPNNNPDGNTLYHLTAQTLRSTVRPYDSDGDGLLDEDAGEDLDGDGFIRQMRRLVGPGKGNAAKDPKDPQGRAMRRVPQGQGDYETFPEGVDNDLDGRYNEDGIGGLDLHRNYPENWRPMREATGRGYSQGGSGEFPLSEPETRAVFLFLMTHPNVGLAQSLDTSVPMILRGPSTASSEDGMYPGRRRARGDVRQEGHGDHRLSLGRRHLSRVRDPRRRQPDDRRPAPRLAHLRPRARLRLLVLRRHLVRRRNLERRPLHRLRQGRPRRREWRRFRWLDENRPGKGDFQAWTPFKHPQLGDVEIGGFNPKFWGQNPPADMIETWARNEAMFNLYLAQQLAQVKLASVTASPSTAGAGVFDVNATVTNEGLIPTALDIAKRVKIVRPDACTIRLAPGQELVKTAEGRNQAAAIEIGWLKAGESKTVTWQVKGAGTATVTASSTRGGVDRRDVAMK